MSVVSGIFGANAASDSQDKATDASSQAQSNATAEQKREFDTTQQNYAPYKAIGEAAAPQFTDFISGKTDITSDPLYKNQMTASTRQATQRAAGSGQSSQGGALQTRLAQLGSDIYNSTYQTKYQELTDALKTGQGAAGSISNAGIAFGNQQQSAATNLGNIAHNNANAQSSLYGGMAGQAGALGSKVFDYGSKNNWWGGNGGAAYDAGGADFSANAPGSGVVDNFGAYLAE